MNGNNLGIAVWAKRETKRAIIKKRNGIVQSIANQEAKSKWQQVDCLAISTWSNNSPWLLLFVLASLLLNRIKYFLAQTQASRMRWHWQEWFMRNARNQNCTNTIWWMESGMLLEQFHGNDWWWSEMRCQWAWQCQVMRQWCCSFMRTTMITLGWQAWEKGGSEKSQVYQARMSEAQWVEQCRHCAIQWVSEGSEEQPSKSKWKEGRGRIPNRKMHCCRIGKLQEEKGNTRQQSACSKWSIRGWQWQWW